MGESSSSDSAVPAGKRLWHTYSAEDLKSTARSLQQNSAIQFHNMQWVDHEAATVTHCSGDDPELLDLNTREVSYWSEIFSSGIIFSVKHCGQLSFPASKRTTKHLIPQLKTHYKTFEDGFVNKVKDELMSAREHPALACGMAVTMGLLLMRGPRRFLFRHTLGRLQSEEAKFNKTENRIQQYGMSVALVKKDGQKLRERALLAEEEMRKGYTNLKNAGDEIQMLSKTIRKFECQAADLMDGLREIPGREAIKLRAEVASMASAAKQQKNALNKRILKISELGIPV